MSTARRKPLSPFWIVAVTSAIIVLGYIVFARFVVPALPVRTYTITSGSMLETFKIGDTIIARQISDAEEVKRGDIIMFNPPEEALHQDQVGKGVVFVSRCIAVAGDVVEIKAGEVYLNGKKQEEPYVSTKPDTDWRLVEDNGSVRPLPISGGEPFSFSLVPKYEFSEEDADRLARLPLAEVPQGHILTMGDNRAGSSDGRSWGPLPRSRVLGKVQGKA